ncbi:spermatogenesis-associated protein 4 [Entophlyctis luteolus]|nr:spermatogenesis-associated protein 4 [Entophlyctis luteolus]
MKPRRETLKWFMSLGIDHKLLNPKWRVDLANGVVIADIFDAYFPGQINTHLFYSGSGLEQKRNNWDQLKKFFKKNEIYIPAEAIDAVMTCQHDAAVLFLENVHMLLTNRRTYPQTLPPQRDLFDTSVPHFAIPTAANIIRADLVPADQADAVIREYNARFKAARQRLMQESANRRKSHASDFDSKQGLSLAKVKVIEIAQRT